MDDTISVVVELPDEVDQKGLFGGSAAARVDIPLSQLSEKLKAEADKLLILLDVIPLEKSWKLAQVEVGVEISAEGGVSFIGTTKVSGQASLKLTFAR